MFIQDNKPALKIIGLILLLNLILKPIVRTWKWREDEFALFDLATEMKTNGTDFYQWLGVEPSASTIDIGKAHRQLVLKLHPETSNEVDAKEKFEITNRVAYILRSPTLRPLYDSVLSNGRAPIWKGFHYIYSRHKLACMVIFGMIAMSVVEYLKAWDAYMTEKLAFDQFVKNAKLMAQRISEKHAAAKSHKSFIDLGDRTIRCEITPEREIFIFNENNERLPLESNNILQKPSIWNLFVLRTIKKQLCTQRGN